jgi:hypothetical protein
MKEPIKLYRMDRSELVDAGVWACGKCGTVRSNEEGAKTCCEEVMCPCGAPVEDRYRTSCRACREKAAYEREMQRWQKMPEFENYFGEPLHDGENFFDDLEDYVDQHVGEDNTVLEEDIEEFLEVAEVKKPGYNIDPEVILDYMRELAFEGVDDSVVEDFAGTLEFKVQIREFLDKQPDRYYVPCNKKIHTKTELERAGFKVIPRKESGTE